MKHILWILVSVYVTLLIDVVFTAPSQTNNVISSSDQLTMSASDNTDNDLDRAKRASRTGQTQSQYLNFGDSQTEGKADAEITRYGSRASVSGSNGMGQAQSQSSGSGCDECYGNENGYSHGSIPDPLRSSSGSLSGLPQSHTTSSIPSIPSGQSGFDNFGRPNINVPNVPGSGYTSQGFGPSNSRLPSSDRGKDVYSHGIPSGGDSLPSSLTSSVPNSGSLTDRQPGIHTSSGREPTNVGSDTFLNRPVGSHGQNGRAPTQPPSILATRRPSSVGLSTSRLIDSPTGTGHSSSPVNFTPIAIDSSSPTATGRLPSRAGSHIPIYNAGTPDGSSQGKNQPIRNGPQDVSGISNTFPENGRIPHGSGFQPIDRNRDSSHSRQPINALDQDKPSSTFENGNNGSPDGHPSTDAISGFKTVFKLPPGLCLVRCETLKPGQALTPDQIKNAFESSLGQAATVPVGQYSPIGQITQAPSVPTQGGNSQIPTLGQNQGQQQESRASFSTPSSTPGQGVGGQYPSNQGVSVGELYPTSHRGQVGGQFPSSQGAPTGGQYPPGQGVSVGTQYPSTQNGQAVGQYPSSESSQVGGQYPSSPRAQIGGLFPSSQGAPVGGQYPTSQGGPVGGQYPTSQGGPVGGQYPSSQGAPVGGQYPSSQGAPIGGQYPTSQGAPISGQYPTSHGGPVGGQYPTSQGSPVGGQYPTSQGGPVGGQYPTSQGGPVGGQFPSSQGAPIGGQYPTSQGGPVGGQYPLSHGGPVGGQFPSSQGAPIGVQYPSSQSAPIGGQYPSSQGAPIGGQYPSSQGVSDGGQYPSNQGGPIGGQYPSSQSSPIGGLYPSGPTTPLSGQIPSTQSAPIAGQYPPNRGVPVGGQYPSSQSGQVGGQYPTSQGPPIGGLYPSGPSAPNQYPSSQNSPISGQYPSSQGTPIRGLYPIGPSAPNQYPSSQGSPIDSQYPPSQNVQVGGQYPTSQGAPTGGQYPSVQSSPISGIYPSNQNAPVGGQFPSGQLQQQQQQQQQQQSGQYTQPGTQYPSPGGIVSQGPASTVFPQLVGGQSQGQGQQIGVPNTYPGQQGSAQTVGGQSGVISPYYSGQGTGYPVAYPQGGGDNSASQSNQINQYVAGEGGSNIGESGTGSTGGEDDGYSQAESSIKNGEVVASAQGTKNGGTAQTQVQGTYTGTGSFSASAQTADKDRSAQAQVSGHKDGALSSSQGTGGKSNAQAQVEVNEKTGSTSSSGQTSGLQHSSQSEVTANEKGGLADAQSSGPGQTSSQAQIGFRPESGSNNQISNIFNGGGQASAQSGVHSGQSQSQIHGNFKYGISYHGAAQAASGTKEQVTSYREKSKKLFQSIGQFTRSNRDAVTSSPVSDIANINDIGAKPKQSSTLPDTISEDSEPDDADYEADEGDGDGDEYDEDDDDATTDATKTTKSKISRMEVQLPPRFDQTNSNKVTSIDSTTTSTTQIPSTILQTKPTKSLRLPAVRSEIVPNGFRGKIDEKRSKQNFTIDKNQVTNHENKVNVKPDSYVTVTKSVSGSLDSAKSTPTDNKQFESTYYTKSSTCGYFTFSCNIVYGSNGRSKICRPKTPANGKC